MPRLCNNMQCCKIFVNFSCWSHPLGTLFPALSPLSSLLPNPSHALSIPPPPFKCKDTVLEGRRWYILEKFSKIYKVVAWKYQLPNQCANSFVTHYSLLWLCVVLCSYSLCCQLQGYFWIPSALGKKLWAVCSPRPHCCPGSNRLGFKTVLENKYVTSKNFGAQLVI